MLAVAWSLVSIGGCDKPAGTATKTVRIDAAASMAYVIEGLAKDIEQDLGVVITVNAGGSGVLAQQIARGNQTDLFISADAVWMDHLNQQGLIDLTTRLDLAGNRLILVGLSETTLHPDSLEDLVRAEYQPIAVGDPSYVPAGRYAVQVFESHGLKSGEGSKGSSEAGLHLAEAPNVRAALAFVLAGQCPVGLVYASDVRGVGEIDLLLTIDPGDHDPIRYPAVVLRDAPNREQAVRVLDWLMGEAAQSAFREAGFQPAR